MGVIKALFGLILIIIIVVLGYWLYATYTVPTGNDKIWVTINSKMPEPLRKWACMEVKARASEAPAPKGCDPFWMTQTAPQQPAMGNQPKASEGNGEGTGTGGTTQNVQ